MRSACKILATLFAAALLAACLASQGLAQTEVLFLHHSTGGNVYWDGGVEDYIAGHDPSVHVEERNYPDSPYDWENYPYDYWNLWINGACDSSNPNIECLDTMAARHDVIIFKHCFPGAGIGEDWDNGDVSSSDKTLNNYKAQYRALRALMDSYPDTKFIVWTLAPLHRLDTDPETAARAAEFVRWVTSDFLTEDGQAHPNIFIFDFWSLAAETNPNPAQGQVNTLRFDYEGSHSDSDSHPNERANRDIGPVFGQFVIDVAHN